jgi:hypothetical protein
MTMSFGLVDGGLSLTGPRDFGAARTARRREF